MSRSRTALHRPLGLTHSLRILISFSVFGFLSIALPSIILIAAYLIIPYPYPVVLLIQTTPYLVTKFIAPSILILIPTHIRPLLLAIGWVVAELITAATPPNVEPQLRVVACVIASVTAAVTDSVFVTLLSEYGTHGQGLVGWGMGTGAGYLACMVVPLVVTTYMGMFVRNVHEYAYYVVVAMLGIYYLILPAAPKYNKTSSSIESDLDHNIEDGPRLPAREPLARPASIVARFRRTWTLVGSVGQPHIVSLAVAGASHFIVSVGLLRLQAATPMFASPLSFSAAYGLAIHSGTSLGRASVLLMRVQNMRRLILRLIIVLALVILNSLFLVVQLPIVILGSAGVVGVLGGAVYANALAGTLETHVPDGNLDHQLLLGSIGVGDAAGWLIGGLVGATLASLGCNMEVGHGLRWCHSGGR